MVGDKGDFVIGHRAGNNSRFAVVVDVDDLQIRHGLHRLNQWNAHLYLVIRLNLHAVFEKRYIVETARVQGRAPLYRQPPGIDPSPPAAWR